MWPADTELGLLADGGPADVAGLVDGRKPEETGGCARRTLGRMTGGGPADVAGFHHHTSSIGSYSAIDGWMMKWLKVSRIQSSLTMSMANET